MKTDERRQRAWDAWLESLPDPAAARAAFEDTKARPEAALLPPALVSAEQEREYREFCASLPDDGGEILLALGQQPLPVPAATEEQPALFNVVECDNGGNWPCTRCFKTARGLAAYLGGLLGRDVVVQCFYGLPLRITAGPQRYLLVNNATAFGIPLYPGGPCKEVDGSIFDGLAIQEDGYLGPRELVENVPLEEEAEPAPVGRPRRGQPDQDDEEEDDDNPEESAV